MSMKNPLTPAGIEPATFRFVTQLLNHCANAVPVWNKDYSKLDGIVTALRLGRGLDFLNEK
jgi:hypothetical protein